MKKPVSYRNRKIIVNGELKDVPKTAKPEPAKVLEVVDQPKKETKKGRPSKYIRYDSEIGIYAIKCDETNSVYIGQSKNIPVRIRQHMHALKNGEYGSRYPDWQGDYDNLGAINFRGESLHACEPDKLLYWETYYIKLYSKEGYTIYNIEHNTVDQKIIKCPSEYADLIKRLVTQLDSGKIHPSQLENALNQLEYF